MEEFTGSHWDILFWTLCAFVSWTHFKRVSSKPEREKPQHFLWPLACVGREMQEAELVGPPRCCGSVPCCGSGTWLWGCVGHVCSGGGTASALRSSPALQQPPYSSRERVVLLDAQLWSSCSPSVSRNPCGFCPGWHLELVEVCNGSSPHTGVKLYSFPWAKENHFSHPK